jgi:SAM-dependent methyltransferase
MLQYPVGSFMPEESYYKALGIDDVFEFYQNKVFGDPVGNFLDDNPLLRFDIKYAKIMWIYNCIRPGSTVLDLGCGSGTFTALKRKNVTLVGIDFSTACLKKAHGIGYDLACCGDIARLPFPNHYFDYVISSDVFGHIEFYQKDQVLAEMKRVLKPDGMVLHGIESMEIDYKNLTEADKKFLSVDGHAGIEGEEQLQARFAKFFAHVETRMHFKVIISYYDLLKEFDAYGLASKYDEDFINRLKQFTQAEIDAFDLAMGHVFYMLTKRDVRMAEDSGFALLKASDRELGPWAGEYPYTKYPQGMVRMDAKDIGPGWYNVEFWPQPVRWTSDHAEFKMETSARSNALLIKASCHHPDLGQNPVTLSVTINQSGIHEFKITTPDWQTFTCPLPDESKGRLIAVELKLNRPYIPSQFTESHDHRRLGIAVERIWLDSF